MRILKGRFQMVTNNLTENIEKETQEVKEIARHTL
jgi:hypothetical protein